MVRIPALVAVIVYHGLRSLPVRYLERDRKRSVSRMARQVGSWGRGVLRCFGVKLVIHGSTANYHGTAGRSGHGGLLVSNHQALMDIFVHGGTFGLRFASKDDVKHWPFIGWYAGMAYTIWVDRNSRMSAGKTLEEFRETLRDNVPLIVYPEGTTTDGFSGLLSFKATAFETIVGTEIPVQPMITIYKPSKHAIHPAWYGNAELLPHLWEMLGNAPVEAHVFIMDPVMADGNNRKELALRVHDIMVLEYNKRMSELYPERSTVGDR